MEPMLIYWPGLFYLLTVLGKQYIIFTHAVVTLLFYRILILCTFELCDSIFSPQCHIVIHCIMTINFALFYTTHGQKENIIVS